MNLNQKKQDNRNNFAYVGIIGFGIYFATIFSFIFLARSFESELLATTLLILLLFLGGAAIGLGIVGSIPKTSVRIVIPLVLGVLMTGVGYYITVFGAWSFKIGA